MATPRKSHRREFLTGHSAARAIEDLVDGRLGDGDAGVELAAPRGDYLVTYERRAMACDFQIVLPARRYAAGAEAALEALDVVDAIEAQLTVYRDDSEVARLNRAAGDDWVVVDAELFALIARSIELYEVTQGAFDATAGPLSRVWGFHRRQGRIPTDDELAEALKCVGSRHVRLDAERVAVRFDQPGVELNFGSIGKGYALDRASGVLAVAEVDDYILHGGKSSVLAHGRGPDATDERPGWSVGIVNPVDRRRRLGTLTLTDRGLATSGTATQFFRYEGRRYGHIIDPRSGWPSEGVYSVTVVADCAAEADALATAF
ncbi:MAG: FAD:protein FMN transferase, partial [Planctomycetales bacterium]|nr:FAD:protein FMN transferase [Planctomycetales bacterium]